MYKRQEFTTIQVIENLIQKLIRRHPHVFGDEKGYSYARWEEIKAKEKGDVYKRQTPAFSRHFCSSNLSPNCISFLLNIILYNNLKNYETKIL